MRFRNGQQFKAPAVICLMLYRRWGKDYVRYRVGCDELHLWSNFFGQQVVVGSEILERIAVRKLKQPGRCDIAATAWSACPTTPTPDASDALEPRVGGSIGC